MTPRFDLSSSSRLETWCRALKEFRAMHVHLDKINDVATMYVRTMGLLCVARL